MPRTARKLSISGYMHIVVRGIGKQIIFEDAADYRRFLSTVERFCRETEVRICAYCLMENHAHLLIRDEQCEVSQFMQKVGTSYSMYFNRKYERNGHLLQGRFYSECVEDETYLLVVLRYILNNPKKAGICDASKYRWSSYALYDNPAPYMDLSLIKKLLGDKTNYEEFINKDEEQPCIDYDTYAKNDAWAKYTIRKCLNVDSGTALQSFERKKRNEALRILKSNGLTNKQIERLTGISRNIVQRA